METVIVTTEAVIEKIMERERWIRSCHNRLKQVLKRLIVLTKWRE